MKQTSETIKENGYEWELRGNEILCDNTPVCRLEFYDGFWRIVGDDYKFETSRSAFYFVMDRCNGN